MKIQLFLYFFTIILLANASHKFRKFDNFHQDAPKYTCIGSIGGSSFCTDTDTESNSSICNHVLFWKYNIEASILEFIVDNNSGSNGEHLIIGLSDLNNKHPWLLNTTKFVQKEACQIIDPMYYELDDGHLKIVHKIDINELMCQSIQLSVNSINKSVFLAQTQLCPHLSQLMYKRCNIMSNSQLKEDASDNSTNNFDSTYVLRVIKASDLSFACLETRMENLIKGIIQSNDNKMTHMSIDVSLNNTEIVNNSGKISYVDFNINLKTPVQLKPAEFHKWLRSSSKKSDVPDNIVVLGDFWIDLKTESKFVNDMMSVEMQMLKYNPLFVLALIIGGSIFSVIFIGCIVAICYTRKPLRRHSKIYEMEAAIRNQVPKIPSIQLGMKTVMLRAVTKVEPRTTYD